MKLAAPILLTLAAIASPAHAQTYKCRDAAGKTTYSNERCEAQGLKASGEVRDRIMVVPGSSAPQSPAAPAAPGKPAAKRDPNEIPTVKLKPPAPAEAAR